MLFKNLDLDRKSFGVGNVMILSGLEMSQGWFWVRAFIWDLRVLVCNDIHVFKYNTFFVYAPWCSPQDVPTLFPCGKKAEVGGDPPPHRRLYICSLWIWSEMYSIESEMSNSMYFLSFLCFLLQKVYWVKKECNRQWSPSKSFTFLSLWIWPEMYSIVRNVDFHVFCCAIKVMLR